MLYGFEEADNPHTPHEPPLLQYLQPLHVVHAVQDALPVQRPPFFISQHEAINSPFCEYA